MGKKARINRYNTINRGIIILVLRRPEDTGYKSAVMLKVTNNIKIPEPAFILRRIITTVG